MTAQTLSRAELTKEVSQLRKDLQLLLKVTYQQARLVAVLEYTRNSDGNVWKHVPSHVATLRDGITTANVKTTAPSLFQDNSFQRIVDHKIGDTQL